METPSSTRRVTRSLTLASSWKTEEPSMQKKQQQQDRSALIDITNDSPIVGLAMGRLKTPSSAFSKKRVSNQGQFIQTPGSGEALLRGQVKTLLQKVEEEAELSKITLDKRPFFNLQGLISSPLDLVAPTPANTPQILNNQIGDCGSDGFPSVTTIAETFFIPQMMNGVVEEGKQGSVETEESVITRSLFLDFLEKSDSSDFSSVVTTYQGVCFGGRERKVSNDNDDDDDDASIWSIQVNASSTRDEDDDEVEEDEEVVEGCIEEEEEEYCLVVHDDWMVDDVCEEMSKISVGPKFEGKHIRFIYNSDGEIEGEEEEVCDTPEE
ncbi:uncharacterized protein LOC121766400 [Salvia splendens]|uniref:uncharacterized protein LOC121766400 n=1 Tax=Salvia splendens TaxID=180675 RepID=UPI001C261696|nr:uncharacterized protein LOC121766400 [Salvia splendens]